jgi:multiple sugar transport system permease protein
MTIELAAPTAERAGVRPRPRLRAAALRAAVYLLCAGGGTLSLLPFIWMVRSSVMEPAQIFAYPPQWTPHPLRLANYREAFADVPSLHYLLNTLTILVPTVVGTVFTSACAAFGFARLRWPGRDWTFALLMTTLILPSVVILIPTYLVWARAHLVNTFVPLILPAWFGGGIFNIFLLRQFFRTIPRELDEAGYIDGATPLEVFWFVILPLSRPALTTVAIFSALAVWNDFLGPLIYLNDPNKFTLALGLTFFTGEYTSQWQLLMAAATMVIGPAVLFFLAAQRYFVQGITLTGIKG